LTLYIAADLPPAVPVVETCKPALNDRPCLTPGVPVMFQGDAFSNLSSKFTVTLPKATIDDGSSCPQVYLGAISSHSFDADVDLVVSLTEADTTPYFGSSTAEIFSFESGDDSKALSFCLNAERETIVYIYVASFPYGDTWSGRVIFTPSATFRRVPLVNLPQEKYFFYTTCK